MATKHKKQAEAARRARRAEAQRIAQQKARRRSRMISIAAGVAAVAIIAALVLANVVGGDDGQDVATSDDSIPTTPTTAPPESAAGKPCLKRTGELPEGAPEVPVREGPPPTELLTEDLAEGDGEVVPEGASVTVNYIGVSCSTGVVFDESYSGGQPASFSLGSVIPGWQQGIPGMKVGGRRLLGIPPELAYQSQGSPPDIAPDETLWFVVEILGLTPAGPAPAP